ncbi:MAG TPA: LamG-like jellyroll fold domain-containing protein [Methylomirabilota bacterium]|nr:LamG-like jellyroll fold domain-containing protein [Methylomirabilota bacterium]
MKTLIRICLPVAVVFASALGACAQTLTVTNELRLWLRGDAGVTTNASGGVIQWNDQSTNGNNAVQAVDTQAPLLVANAVNAKPVLRFDGADDYLDVPDSESLSGVGDMASFFVIKFDDFAAFRAVWGKTAGAGGNQPAPTDAYVVPAPGPTVLRVFRGDGTGVGNSSTDTAQPLVANAYLALGFDVEGSTLTHYLNNQPNGSGPASAAVGDGNTALKIGSRTDLFTKLKGDFAELLIYSRALSPLERSNVFNYLRTKYSLNVPPAVNLTATPPGPNVNIGDVITLNATAIDSDGNVARVEFFANGGSLGAVTVPPYSLRVRIDSPGTVTFTARATDNAGAFSNSAPVVLTASAGAPTPLSVTNGLQLWLKADAGTTVGGSGGVTQWADQSGHGNHAAQVTEAMAPVLTNSAVNGLPTLRFDGADDFLEVADSDSISITGDITTLFVLKFADFATFRAIWAKTAVNQPAPTDIYTMSGNGRVRFFRGNGTVNGVADSSQAFVANSFILGGVEMAGTAVRHYYNGLLNGSGNITAAVADANGTLRIGTRADGVTRMKGEMAEILIFNRSLLAAERRSVEIYLAGKYGLPALVSTTNSAPVVVISSPGGGQILQAPAAVTVTASASDADGSIVSVQLFADGQLLGTDTAAPYSTNLNLNYGGRVTLTAIATDNLGAQSSSAPVEATLQGPSAPTGLMGYWPLDGNANAVIGQNGIMVSNPVVTPDRNDTAGGALLFDGTLQQYVQIPGGGGLNGAPRGTISMWVKWLGTQDSGAATSFGAVLSRQQNGSFSDNIISLNNADPNVGAVQWRQNSGAITITGAGTVGHDFWRHIVVTFTETNCDLFVDGFYEASGVGGALHNNWATALAIGAWSGDGQCFATAAIDDVAVWNRVLTFDEIQHLIAQTRTPLTLNLTPDLPSVERSGGNVIVRWGSGAVLQSAGDVNGPFSDLTGATSPYMTNGAGAQTFYRLRLPQ